MSACYNNNWKRRFPRWINRIYAKAFDYFWLPCDMCGRDFGGHEVANEALIDPKSRWALRYSDGTLAGEIGRSVCWICRDEVRPENERRAAAIVAKGGEITYSPPITLGPGESVSFFIPLGHGPVSKEDQSRV